MCIMKPTIILLIVAFTCLTVSSPGQEARKVSQIAPVNLQASKTRDKKEIERRAWIIAEQIMKQEAKERQIRALERIADNLDRLR